MGKSLDEIYNKIQLQRQESKRIEESKINELNLIRENQIKSHLFDRNMYMKYSSGHNVDINYVDNDFVDDYFF